MQGRFHESYGAKYTCGADILRGSAGRDLFCSAVQIFATEDQRSNDATHGNLCQDSGDYT